MDLPEVVRTYQRDGVVVIPALLDEAERNAIRQRLEQYTREKPPSLPNGDYTLESDGATVRNLWRIEKHDLWFDGFAHHCSQASRLSLVLVFPGRHTATDAALFESYQRALALTPQSA